MIPQHICRPIRDKYLIYWSGYIMLVSLHFIVVGYWKIFGDGENAWFASGNIFNQNKWTATHEKGAKQKKKKNTSAAALVVSLHINGFWLNASCSCLAIYAVPLECIMNAQTNKNSFFVIRWTRRLGRKKMLVSLKMFIPRSGCYGFVTVKNTQWFC